MMLRTLAIGMMLALSAATPAMSKLDSGRNPAPEVYPGCTPPPAGPWASTPANLTTNHTWFINPNSGSNSNDGTTQTTGGGHGPWLSTSPIASAVHGGDVVYLASGNYGDVTISSTNSVPVTMEPLSSDVTPPLFNSFTLTGSQWVFKGFKVLPSNPSSHPIAFFINAAVTNVVVIGSELTNFGTGFLDQNVAAWTGSIPANSAVLTVTQMRSITTIGIGWSINWAFQNGGTAATIQSQLTSTEPDGSLGKRGTYQLSAAQTTAFPIMGSLTIMAALSPAMEAGLVGGDSAGLLVAGGSCVSIIGNHIHDALYAISSVGSGNTLVKDNQIDHWYKSAVVYGNGTSNETFEGNYLHDAMCPPNCHPDMIQYFCNQLHCIQYNVKMHGNLYIQQTDPNATIMAGSFGFFMQGGFRDEQICNLEITDNILITDQLWPILTYHTCGGIIANNTIVPFGDTTVGEPNGIQYGDQTFTTTAAAWSGGSADFAVTFSSSHPSVADISPPDVITAVGYTPSGYNGAWTVTNSFGPASAVSVTSSGSGGSAGSYTGVTQASTTGSGSGATFNVTVNGSGQASGVSSSGGSLYQLNDFITLQAGGGVPTGVIVQINGANQISDVRVTMPSNPGGAATAIGLFGFPAHQVLIENNITPALGLSTPMSLDVTQIGTTVVPCAPCSPNGIFSYQFAGMTTGVSCNATCNDYYGNPVTFLSPGATQSASVWQQWNPATFLFNMRPQASASAIVGQGAPWNMSNAAGQFYNPAHDQRGRPWPNPPDLGAVLH
jgi:hypothetical protein